MYCQLHSCFSKYYASEYYKLIFFPIINSHSFESFILVFPNLIIKLYFIHSFVRCLFSFKRVEDMFLSALVNK